MPRKKGRSEGRVAPNQTIFLESSVPADSGTENPRFDLLVRRCGGIRADPEGLTPRAHNTLSTKVPMWLCADVQAHADYLRIETTSGQVVIDGFARGLFYTSLRRRLQGNRPSFTSGFRFQSTESQAAQIPDSGSVFVSVLLAKSQ